MRVECAVWALLVVMADIDAQDAIELALAEDERPVQAFPPRAADPALDVRVGVRCLERRRDDP